MADAKLTALTEVTAVEVGNADMLYVVTGVATSAVSKKATPLEVGATSVKIADVAVSATSSAVSCFFDPARFVELEISFAGYKVDGSLPDPFMRFSSDGATYDSGNNYNYWYALNYTGGASNSGTDADSKVKFQTADNGATDVGFIKVFMGNPNQSTRKVGNFRQAQYRTSFGPFLSIKGDCGWTDTGVIKGVQFVPSAGAFTAGRLTVWGKR